MFRATLCLAIILGCLLVAASSTLWSQQPPPAQGDENQLISVLQSEAPLFDKAKACQQLAVTGSKKAVPTLAKLLDDEQLAHYARYGLEPIPDPSVDEALRAAMGRLQGKLLVGVINSVGMRRDEQAVGGLSELLDSPDPKVPAAAAAALGRIANADAVQVLREKLRGAEGLRPVAGKACLTAAETLLARGERAKAIEILDVLREADLPKYQHVAALQGAIRVRGDDGLPLLIEQLRAEDPSLFRVALGAAHQMGGPQLTKALVEEMDQLSPVRKSLVIYVLGDLGDKAALPAVAAVAKSGPVEARIAATRALATLGNASIVPALLDMAVGENDALAQAARDSLAKLPGKEVGEALTARLEGSEGGALVVAIELIGQRVVASAVPVLIEAADHEDEQIRAAAINALGLTVDLERLASLIDRLVKPIKPEDASVTKEALRKACLRMPDRDACADQLLARLPATSLGTKSDLLDLLREVGGAKALEGVSAAARDGSDAVQDAATRVLGEWMSADVAPVLLELARTGSEKYKVRALRGYIRIIRQFGNLTPEQRLSMCRTAIELAQRDAEKQLVLDASTRVHTLDALNFVSAYLDDDSLQKNAAAAAVSIGEQIVDAQPAAVGAAMKKAIDATGNDEITSRAQAILQKANRRNRRN